MDPFCSYQNGESESIGRQANTKNNAEGRLDVLQVSPLRPSIPTQVVLREVVRTSLHHLGIHGVSHRRQGKRFL